MTIDLYATQEALEKHPRTLIQKLFNDILTDNQNKGNESSTYYGSPLMKRAIEPVATRIIETIEEAESGKAGTKSSAVKFLKLLDPNVIAFFTAKVVIDKITSQSNKLQTVANNIGKQLEDELRYTNFGERHPWLFKKPLTEIDTTRQHNRQNLVSAYNRYCEQWVSWGDDARIHLGMKLLHIFTNKTGFADIVTRRYAKNRTEKLVLATAALTINRSNDDATLVVKPTPQSGNSLTTFLFV